MTNKIHIGELIHRKLEEDGRSAAWLARQIPCSKKHVYKILGKEDIHPSQLRRISIALKFDFFVYYSESVRKKI